MRFTTRLRWTMAYFFLAFIVLFVLRLGYGYLQYPNTGPNEEWYSAAQESFSGQLSQTRKNYATEKKARTSAAPQVIDQKFEKTASVASKTRQFVEDEQKLRELIQAKSGIIQDESTQGNEGRRQLHLIIGVAPDSFELFYDAVHGIGNIVSTSTYKQDKTNEYLALQAKRASLESTRAAFA